MLVVLKVVSFVDANEESIKGIVNMLKQYDRSSVADYAISTEGKLYVIVGNSNDKSNLDTLLTAAKRLETSTY